MVMGRHAVLTLQDGVGVQMEGEVETMTGPFLSLSVSLGGWAEPSLSVLPQRYLISLPLSSFRSHPLSITRFLVQTVCRPGHSLVSSTTMET